MITTRIAVAAIGLSAAAVSLAGPTALVAWAPGYPGNTEQAQPVMDDLARRIESAAGWPEGRLSAVYHQTLDGGLERLADTDAALAMVPLPIFLEYRERLALEPLVEIVAETGRRERWDLVARKGAVHDPSALAGWEIRSVAGHSPTFVESVALHDWGVLPGDVRIGPSRRVASDLREAARGESIAVLLDQGQAEALPSLPYAADLEVVARSRPLVGNLLCSVKGRLRPEEVERLTRALLALHESEAGAELLATLRMQRFEPVAPADLEEAVRLYDGRESAER